MRFHYFVATILTAFVGFFTLFVVYYSEYYILGGFHPGWYYSYGYLLSIPISLGVVLSFIINKKPLKSFVFFGLLIFVLSVFFYRFGPLGTPWSEIKFTLYHIPMAWFPTLAMFGTLRKLLGQNS